MYMIYIYIYIYIYTYRKLVYMDFFLHLKAPAGGRGPNNLELSRERVLHDGPLLTSAGVRRGSATSLHTGKKRLIFPNW